MSSPDSATVEERYRDALSNRDNVNLLVRELAHLETLSLLVKTEALSKLEEGELRATIKEDHDRFRRVVEILLEKGSRRCYVGFSRVIYFLNEYVGRTVFPFANELGDEHCPLTVRPLIIHPPTGAVRPTIEPAPTQPDILWVCASEELYQLAAMENVSDFQGVKQTPSKKFKYQELEMYPGAWVMCPAHIDHLREKSLRGLLRHFNRTRFLLLTAECDLIQQGDPDGSVQVASTTGNGCAFIAELRHMTALWQLRGEECSWHCDRAPVDADHPVVRFCSLGEEVNCKEAIALYTAADGVWADGIKTFHAAIISRRGGDGCPTCGGHTALHSIQYSFKIVKYLSQNMPWVCRHSS